MLGHNPNAAVEWPRDEVAAMVAKYPHLTAMEIARRTGWTTWRVMGIFSNLKLGEPK